MPDDPHADAERTMGEPDAYAEWLKAGNARMSSLGHPSEDLRPGGSGAGSNQDGVTLEVMASLMALRDAVERRTAEDQYCWVCQRTWGMPKTRLEQHAEDCALFNVRKVVGYARP